MTGATDYAPAEPYGGFAADISVARLPTNLRVPNAGIDLGENGSVTPGRRGSVNSVVDSFVDQNGKPPATPYAATCDGGAGSHRRTRLRLGIPCSAGKYREILPLAAGDGDTAIAFASKFKAFPTNSLKIGAGNFAD